MASREALVRNYYSSQREKIIDCPFQPGNLKISETACLKRYKAAQRANPETFKTEDIFKYFVSQGLLKCQKCPIIKKTALRGVSDSPVFLIRPS
ncbi:MAG: hypothetical protein C0407_06925 [Desulfobacca sp.]|nr:hypothetical protein [Desulfobacca sp.]